VSANFGQLDNLRALVTALTEAVARMQESAPLVASAAGGFSQLSARADLFLENEDQAFLAGALAGLDESLDRTAEGIEIACDRVVDEDVAQASNDLTTLEAEARQAGKAFETAAGGLAERADAMLERVQSAGTALAEEVDELVSASQEHQQELLTGFRSVADLVETLESGLGHDLAEASVAAFAASEHGEVALQGVRQAATAAIQVFASRVASVSSAHKASQDTLEQSYTTCQETVTESLRAFREGLAATVDRHRESVDTGATTLEDDSAGPLACAGRLATVLTALADGRAPLGAAAESTDGLELLAANVRAAYPVADAARAVVAVMGGE
jgi:chromosome segregation ATPase